MVAEQILFENMAAIHLFGLVNYIICSKSSIVPLYDLKERTIVYCLEVESLYFKFCLAER